MDFAVQPYRGQPVPTWWEGASQLSNQVLGRSATVRVTS